MIKKRYKTPMAKFHELNTAGILVTESELNLQSNEGRYRKMNTNVYEEQW
ncbi:MAG: hypothetical protein Q4E68_00570 [Prevotellaceae bacterium]|nr:hypothetical protein [Prevotellaceae bacterium]